MSSAPGEDEEEEGQAGREGGEDESESQSEAEDDFDISATRIGSLMPQVSQTTIGEELSRESSLLMEEDLPRRGSFVAGSGSSAVPQISQTTLGGEELSRESLLMSEESPRQEEAEHQQRPDFGSREFLLMGSPPTGAAASHLRVDVDNIMGIVPPTDLMSPMGSDDEGEVDKSEDPWEYQGDRDEEGNPHGIGYCVYRGEIWQFFGTFMYIYTYTYTLRSRMLRLRKGEIWQLSSGACKHGNFFQRHDTASPVGIHDLAAQR